MRSSTPTSEYESHSFGLGRNVCKLSPEKQPSLNFHRCYSQRRPLSIPWIVNSFESFSKSKVVPLTKLLLFITMQVHPRYPVKVLSFIRRPITFSPSVLPSQYRAGFMYISSVMSRVIYNFDAFGIIPNRTTRIPNI
jgi:hypothetical protein